MGERIRAHDWSKTPLGVLDQWPQSLRSALSICLGSRFPIVIFWSARCVVLYNDAYAEILGKKHPWALGRPCSEVWAEIWDVIAPMLDSVLKTGEATWSDDQLLLLERRGYLEECYFSFSFSSLRDASGAVAGIFTAVIENTRRVQGERHLRTLRDLAAKCKGAESEAAAYQGAADVLSANPYDVPFALIYCIDHWESLATLAATVGIEPRTPASPVRVELESQTSGAWSLGAVARSGKPLVIANVSDHVGALPTGAWKIPPHTAIVLPVLLPGQDRPRAIIAAGVSPMRALDEDHQTFFGLLATQIASGLADAEALEQERRRAEALAEIDRAKTAFFANVSHEFRTPLTLMLGPVGDALADAALEPRNRERLEIAQRNSLRLLKLVNTLLDFSRIEAGRMQATYEPVDLAALTTDLASVFRSAIEKAGLRLVVDSPALPDDVYVDREMWEKIVLNLLSNAFKFTFNGQIDVRLRQHTNHVELSVRDTGIGIPAAELPNIFKRFHRVQGVRSRSHEGTGIGLGLVQELVRLHGGAIAAASTEGAGTEFTVTIPLGTTHLPPEQIRGARALESMASGAAPFIDEALRWLPGDPSAAALKHDVPRTLAPTSSDHGIGLPEASARIIWADDNADMRDYVTRLLSPPYDVEAVADGALALAAVSRQMPDLVLVDVMMPACDGISVLRTLKADAATADIPVILISARAGEESRIEGMDAGADDYLIKPFSARELLARVDAHVRAARLRRESLAIIRASQARQAFLLQFSDALRPLADPVAIQETAARLLAEHLAVSRAFYYAVEAGPNGVVHVVASDFAKDPHAASVAGRYPQAAFGTARFDKFSAGERLVVPEVNDLSVLTPTEHQACLALGVRAFVAVPLVKSGEYVGGLVTLHSQRKCWRADEVALVEETAERTWSAVERASAEAALLASQAKLLEATRLKDEFITTVSNDLRWTAAMVEHSNDAIIGKTLDGIMTSWNPGAEALYGYTATEMIGRHISTLVPPERRHEPGALERIKRGEMVHRYDTEHVTKAGRRIDVSITASGIRDTNGTLIGASVIARDISERTRAEKKLRALLDGAPDAMVLVDPAGRITMVNAQVEALLGYRHEDLVGKPVEVLVPAHQRPAHLTHRREYLQAARARPMGAGLELSAVRKDGREVPIEISLSPMPGDEGTMVLAAVRDVTARRRRERQLREANEELRVFRRVIEESPYGISVVNRAYTHRVVNRVYMDLHDRPAEDIVGRTVAELLGWAIFRDTVRPMLDRCFAGESVRYEALLDFPTGPRSMELRYYPLRKDGRVEYAVMVTHDLTERKRMMEELRLSEAKLAHISRVATMGELASSIAHEINQPLAAIVNDGAACLRWLNYQPPALDEARSSVQHMIGDANRASHVIARIRALLARKPSAKTTFDPNHLVRDTVALVRGEIGRAGAVLSTDLAPELPLVIGDRIQLQQVLLNLLMNALEAVSPVDDGPREVRVLSAPGASSTVVVAVRDSGVGITPDLRKRIFEPFYTTKPEGLGMGLAISRSIIEEHGGQLWAADHDGSGATVQFTIPIAGEES